MSTSIHNLTQQYAVILVRRKPRPERSVVAYSDEKTLRAFLAEPSIVSLGYRSREKAMATLDVCAPACHASPASSNPASVGLADRSLDESATTHVLFRCGFELAKPREFIRGLLQLSFAAAIAFLYSKNLLSTAIRAVISS